MGYIVCYWTCCYGPTYIKFWFNGLIPVNYESYIWGIGGCGGYGGCEGFAYLLISGWFWLIGFGTGSSLQGGIGGYGIHKLSIESAVVG